MKKMNKYQPVHHGGASVVEMKEYPANLNNHVNQNESPPGGLGTGGIGDGRIGNGGINSGIMLGRINGNNMCHDHECESNGVTQKTKEVYEEVLNCTYCNKHVKPIVKKYTPFFVYIIILVLFLFLSIFTIFLLPITVLTFKQKRYICPSCNKNLTSTEKMFTIKREDKILIFQCSKCAIIVSVKYLVLFILLVVLIFSFYIIRRSTNFNLDLLGKGPLINTTWTDFLEDCGNKSQFRNKFHSINNFKNKYYGNTVIWRGHFHHITEGFFNSNSLFIKMVPSEYKYDRPDMQIFFNNSLISKIENLEKNDYVEFECTLLEISKNKKPHLCLLWDVKLVEKYTPKQFTVIEYFRPVSIFDIINLYAPNPFFINLDDQPNTGPTVEVINIPGTNVHDNERFDSEDDVMINFLKHEIHDMGEDTKKKGSVDVESSGRNAHGRVHIDKEGKEYKAKGTHFIKGEEGHPVISHFEDYNIFFSGHQMTEDETDDDNDDDDDDYDKEEEDEDEVENGTYEEYFGSGQPHIYGYVDGSEEKTQTQEQKKKQEQKQEQEKTHEETRQPKEEREKEQKPVQGEEEDQNQEKIQKQEKIQEEEKIQNQEKVQGQEQIQTEKQTENGEEMKDESMYDYQFHIDAEEAISNMETEESNNYDSIVKKEKKKKGTK